MTTVDVSENQAKNFFTGLFDKFQEKYLTGILANDSKGHSIPISFRVSPSQNDLNMQVMRLMTDIGWKTNSDFYRSIFAMGIKVALELFKDRKLGDPDKLDAFNNKLELMSVIAAHAREKELIEDVKRLKGNVGDMVSDEKYEIMKVLDKIERNFKEFTKGDI